MSKRIIVTDEFDWNLSTGQKKVTAWALGTLAAIAMITYSFPNTFRFFDSIIDISDHSWVNGIVSFTVALFFNGLEIFSLYLLVWQIKESIPAAVLAVLLILVCAFFSTVGTFGSMETSDQKTAAKIQVTEYLQAETANIQNSIAEKTKLLAANNQQIARLENEELNVPTYVYNRSTQLSREIDDLNLQYSEKSRNASEATIKAPKMPFSAKVKRFFNLIFSPTIELLMLICSLFSIILYKEIIRVDEDDEDYETTDEGFIYQGCEHRTKYPLGGPIPAAAKNNDRHVGFEVDNSEPKKRFQIVSRHTETIPENEFIHRLKKRSKTGTVTDENVSKAFHGNDSETFQETKNGNDRNVSGNDLRNVFETKFQGKSDPFILYCFDNWNDITDEKFSYLKLAKTVSQALPGRQTISKSYAWRIVQANRFEEGGAA